MFVLISITHGSMEATSKQRKLFSNFNLTLLHLKWQKQQQINFSTTTSQQNRLTDCLKWRYFECMLRHCFHLLFRCEWVFISQATRCAATLPFQSQSQSNAGLTCNRTNILTVLIPPIRRTLETKLIELP